MKPENLLFAAIGFIDEALDNTAALLDELVERGRLKSADSKGMLDRIVDRARGEKREADDIVVEIAADARETSGLAGREDIERLMSKLAQLEEQLTEIKETNDAEKAKKT
jgi:polyhydroxyalkanoate synthesis regulator phasin